VTYKYDVFLSYPRAAGADAWVREHFHRALHQELTHHKRDEPSIFADWTVDTGVAWPQKLADAAALVLLHTDHARTT
jgi:hypothetical protein